MPGAAVKYTQGHAMRYWRHSDAEWGMVARQLRV